MCHSVFCVIAIIIIIIFFLYFFLPVTSKTEKKQNVGYCVLISPYGKRFPSLSCNVKKKKKTPPAQEREREEEREPRWGESDVTKCARLQEPL